ncbi:acetolactate synthase [Alicyclobacillus curvatus]|nr:acetolactate synthase [Alicyclobacillus curvatus]
MSEPMTGGRLVTLCLSREHVKHVFCVPGESYLEVLDGLYDFPEMQLISARHESGAAFMAEAYAKASGQVGVCMATRAVGLSNLSIGLHTARQDSTPVVALVGHVPQPHQEREAFQEVPLAEWFRPVCKWTVEIREVDRIPELIHRAFYVARSGRPGPVLVVLPQDVLEAQSTNTYVITPYHASAMQPDAAAVEAVHSALSAAKRPMLIVGGGVSRSGATDSVLQVANRYAMPVVTAFRRFDAIPNSADHYAGWLGFGPHRTLLEELRHADVVLTVGTRLSQITTQDYSLPSRETKVFVVDVDPLSGVTAHPPELTITSDADAFCRQLLVSRPEDNLSHAVRELRQDRVHQLHRAYLQFSDARQLDSPKYVNLEGMMYDFVRTVPADTLITSDAGNFFGWLARYYRFEMAGTYVGPTSGAMGYALPAAIGAKLARPAQTVVAFAGDGGFMMTMSEMATAMMYGVKVIAIVINNNCYGTIRAHQERRHKGRPLGTDLWNPSFSDLARSFGGFGVTVKTNAAFVPALESALQTEKFAVIEVLSDPSILSVSQEV